MAAFSFSDIPWWGWALIVLAIVVIAPLKLRIMKTMFGGAKKKPAEEDEEA